MFHGPSRSVFVYCVQLGEFVFTKCDNFCFLVFQCTVGKSCGVKTFLDHPFTYSCALLLCYSLRGEGSVVRKRVAKKKSTAVSERVMRKFLLRNFLQLHREKQENRNCHTL